MQEILIDEFEHVRLVAKGLVLGPLAMREFLRSEATAYENGEDQDVMFDRITGRLVWGEQGIQSHLDEGRDYKELVLIEDILAYPEIVPDGYRHDPGLYREWSEEDFVLGGKWLIRKARLRDPS